MSLSLVQVINNISDYHIGKDDDDISMEQLEIYKSLVAEDVKRRNPGFVGDELTLFTAYSVLDKIENRSGTGPRTQEKIKDNAYTIRAVQGTSFWMDCQNQMIYDYLTANLQGVEIGNGSIRDDADMSEFSDGSHLEPERSL